MTTGTEIEIALGALALLGGIAALLRKPRDPSVTRWLPLARLVEGTTRQNVMVGVFEGIPLRARIVGSGSEGNPFTYELSFMPGAQGQNWSLTFTGQKFLGTGEKAWRVKSRDETLAGRFAEAGAAQSMQGWPSTPEITYNAKSGNLEYRDRAGGEYALPSVEDFQSQLVLLAKLIAMHRQVNP